MTRNFLRTGIVFCFNAFAAAAQPYYAPEYSPQNNDYYYSPPQNYSSAPANSQPDDSFLFEGGRTYFRAEIGPSFFDDTRLTRFGVPANDPVKFRVGGTVDAAAGIAFNRYLSSDFEFGFIGARVDSIRYFFANDSGLYNLPFLFNIAGSLPLDDGRIVPYLGAGVGGAVAVFDADRMTTPIPQGEPVLDGTEADVVFAGQIFAGVRFQLNRDMWVGAGYKYFTTGDPTWNYPGNFKFGIKGVATHSIMFTFLYKF